uniref:Uncharacterized protein n=1 Tax=Anguilla anguilla TaxID=7936 RepID=A0A0E9T9F3_ANGAN
MATIKQKMEAFWAYFPKSRALCYLLTRGEMMLWYVFHNLRYISADECF